MAARRRYLRLEWRGRVEWRKVPKTEAEEELLRFNTTEAQDVGLNGVSFLADRAVPVGTRIEVRIVAGVASLSTLAEVAWLTPLQQPKGDCNFCIGAEFLSVPDPGIHRLMMELYRQIDSLHTCACIRAVLCSPAQRSLCPAPKEGKNCWQYHQTPCCSRDRSLCLDCPISLATLLVAR